MSAVTAPMDLDVTSTPAVPMLRLAKVEFRKALDTRAGRWLVISILGLAVVVAVIYALAAPDTDKDLTDFMLVAGGTIGYFVPIIVIMLVTSEASQRNGLVTFTLEPQRSRVVLAKFMAGLGLALSVMVIALLVAVLGTAFGSLTGGSPDWSINGDLFFSGYVVSNLIGVFVGFALSMLIMNTPGAIVAYFAYTIILPTAVGILSALSDTFEDIAPWIEFNTAQVPLVDGDFSPTGEEWAQIATSGFIWLIIPLALGIWRLLRIEFK